MLQAFCENVFHVGPPGSGHVLKLVNNMLAMSMAASIAEAVAVAAKGGLALDKLYDVVSAGGVNSGIFQMMFGKMLQGDLSGLKFAIANAQKDLRYYTHLAESLPVASFMGEAAHQSFVQAANLGFGDKFIASLFEAQELTAKVRIVPRALTAAGFQRRPRRPPFNHGDLHERHRRRRKAFQRAAPQAAEGLGADPGRRRPVRRGAVLRAVEGEPRVGAERAEEAARDRPDDGQQRPVRRVGRRRAARRDDGDQGVQRQGRRARPARSRRSTWTPRRRPRPAPGSPSG